jgi:hypothetical protein
MALEWGLTLFGVRPRPRRRRRRHLHWWRRARGLGEDAEEGKERKIKKSKERRPTGRLVVRRVG